MRIFLRFLFLLVVLSAGISVILAIDNPTPISVTGEDGIERIGYFLSMPDNPVSQPDDATIEILSPAGFNAQPQIDVLNSTVTQIRIDTGTLAAANSGFNIFRSTAQVKIDALGVSTTSLLSFIQSTAALSSFQFAAAFSSISTLQIATATLSAQTTYNILNPSNTNYIFNQNRSVQIATFSVNLAKAQLAVIGNGSLPAGSTILKVSSINADLNFGWSPDVATHFISAFSTSWPGNYQDLSISANSVKFNTGNFSGNVANAVITNPGNVGIGTLSPTSKVHVFNGDLAVSGLSNQDILLNGRSLSNQFTAAFSSITTLQAATATLSYQISFSTLNPSNTNYINTSVVTQTKIGGLNVNGFVQTGSATVQGDFLVRNILIGNKRPATTLNAGIGSTSSGEYINGWQFIVSSRDIYVTDLGYYASSLASGSRPVGIFTAAGVLVSSADVQSTDASNGLYKFHSIPTVKLSAGNEYAILTAVPVNESRLQGLYTGVGMTNSITAVSSKTYVSTLYNPPLALPGSEDVSGVIFYQAGFNFTVADNLLSVSTSAFGFGTNSPAAYFHVAIPSFVITSNGNVGIGTNNPLSKLMVTMDSVYGSGNYHMSLSGSSNANKKMQLGYDTTSDYGWIQPLIEGTAYKNLALNPSGGNVGIGTANPSERLHVNQTSGAGKAIIGSTDGGANDDELQFRSAYSGLANSSDITGSIVGAPSNDGGRLILKTSQNTTGTLTERMRIDDFGNVGIGTNNPGKKLTVDGNMEVGINSADYHHLRIGGGNSSGYAYGAFAKYGDGIHLGYNFYNDNASNVIDNSGGSTSRLSLSYGSIAMYTGTINTEPTNLGYYQNSAGNVGIGTTGPAAKLHVYRSGNEQVAFTNSSLTSPDRSSISIDSSEGLQIFTGRTNSAKNNFTLRSGDLDNSSSASLTVLGSNGNVGIGTTAPSEQLTIGGSGKFALIHSGAAWDHLRISHDGSSALFDAGGAESGMAFRVDATAVGYPASSYTEVMRLASSGNVGIGTPSPAGKFNIWNSNGEMARFAQSASGATSMNIFRLNTGIETDANKSQNFTWYVNQDAAGLPIQSISLWQYPSDGLPSCCLHHVTFGTDASNQVYQAFNGNTGVGTGLSSNPANLFRVAGSQTQGNVTTARQVGIGVDNNASYSLALGYHQPASGTWKGVIQALDNNAGSDLLLNPSGGNVGIGSVGPTQKLDVAGDAYKSAGGLSWAVTSDKRLKNIKGSFSAGLKEIETIQPVRFSYKADKEKREQIGLIAQEVQKVIPEAVSEDQNGYLSMHADPVIWAMLNSIKELSEEVKKIKKAEEGRQVPKYKNKPLERLYFNPDKLDPREDEWPKYIVPWKQNNPSDGSLGYIEIEGEKVHIYRDSWIFTNELGFMSVQSGVSVRQYGIQY